MAEKPFRYFELPPIPEGVDPKMVNYLISLGDAIDDLIKNYIKPMTHQVEPTPIVNLTIRAKVVAVGTTTLTANLLDEVDGVYQTDALTIKPIHKEANNLNGSVTPSLSADDIISVFKSVDGSLYTTFPFIDA
jgi:hypothetical protein